MPKSIKILFAAAALLILAGGIGSLFTVKSALGSVSTEEQVMKADNISAINIRDFQSIDSEINVTRADSPDQAAVEWTNNLTSDKVDQLSVGTQNGELSVKLKRKPFKLINFGLDFFEENELTISLPDQLYDSLHVKNMSGAISMSQIKADNVDIHVDNGKVDLNHLKTDKTDVGIDNGQLIMEDLTGKVSGQTDNGEIRMKTADLDRDMDLSVKNGQIIVKTEKRPTNAWIDARTDVGSVNLFGDGNSQTDYGDADHHVQLTTKTGLIHVEKQ